MAAQDVKSGLRPFHELIGTAFRVLGDLGKEAEECNASIGFDIDDVTALCPDE